MTAAPSYAAKTEYAAAKPQSPDEEAIARLRLATGVSLIAEVILPVVEAIAFTRPDWLAIEIQAIWFALTLCLLAATWHRRFYAVWRPAVLIFSAALIFSSGILSIKGASLAPFMFLLVLLPVGGICLPWEPSWQAVMSSLCVVFGLLFSSQFNWQDHLVISGLSAMLASILGSHLVSVALTKQRTSINNYLSALSRSEKKFREIFETSGSLIAIYSMPDGRILDVNPAWERTLGFSRSEAVGRLPTDLGLISDPKNFAEWIKSLRMGDSGLEQDPVVFTGRGKNPVYCLYSWSTLELDRKQCVLVIGQDITPRVRAEEELRRNREVLLNQERLKAVGELASGMAHDLNNSLNALRLRVELLTAEPSLSPQALDSLRLISRIVGDASSTIGRLQDFARRRHDRPIETLNLNAIIRQSVEIARSTLEEKGALLGRSIRVELELPSLPAVIGEPSEVRQIFLNLLLNAQDAMPQGGTVRIGGRASEGAVAITVADEGQGIAPDHLDRIFDPFFTTKGERGTGLGLSTAYGAMQRLGGAISAANRPEGGAIFTLTFPTSSRAAAPIEQVTTKRASPRRVMAIDDDSHNLEALRALLESWGHSVIGANSGAEALRQLAGGARVDVVLCDLGMPSVNGWEIARRVKSMPTPPVFYLVTGWAQEIAADDPRRRLVDEVVAKPLDPRVLHRLLAEAGDRVDAKTAPPSGNGDSPSHGEDHC
jgi:PAS domain S-box-containing protein